MTRALCMLLALLSSAQCAVAQQAPRPSSQVKVEASARARLEAELHEVRVERAEMSRPWPAVVLGVGVASVLTGTGVGAGYVLGCDDSCTVPAFVTFAVVLGAVTATAGGVWWLRQDRAIAAVLSRQWQLERDLDRLRVHARLRAPLTASGHELLRIRLAL